MVRRGARLMQHDKVPQFRLLGTLGQITHLWISSVFFDHFYEECQRTDAATTKHLPAPRIATPKAYFRPPQLD